MLESITRIQDVFEAWRELGHKKLPNGTEVIGRQVDGDHDGWMHAVFPRLQPEHLALMEEQLQTPLPAGLRKFYSACGGMILFGGLFRIFGLPLSRGVLFEHGIVPDDIITLNHELDHCEWKPAGGIAFAVNEWDASIYFAGVDGEESEIVRVSRAEGEVLERTDSVWKLVAEKLYRLDEMFVR